MVCLVINICKVAVKLELIVQWVSGHLPTVFSVRGGRTTWGGGDLAGGEGGGTQPADPVLFGCMCARGAVQCDPM